MATTSSKKPRKTTTSSAPALDSTSALKKFAEARAKAHTLALKQYKASCITELRDISWSLRDVTQDPGARLVTAALLMVVHSLDDIRNEL